MTEVAQPATATQQLIAMAQRLTDIANEVRYARELPQRTARDVERVQITVERGYSYNEKIPPVASEAARRIRSQLDSEFRASAERQRDAKLVEIAAELQSIRAALPGLAARAAIELGHQARMLQHEANGGTD